MAEHDRDAGMHPTNQLLSLPAELIRACLAHLTPVDALRACCTCRELKTESASDGVWKELYRRRWPQWTLLASARPSGVTWLVTFKARYCHEVTLIVPEDHVFLMSGHCRDLYDNNTTPMLAAMCRAPRDFERIGVDHFSLLGEVQYSKGTLHNEPRKTTFYGSCAIERHRVGAHPLDVEWREHAKAFGHWVYRGRVTEDGRSISGSYYLSALPRKRGTFELRALDPSRADALLAEQHAELQRAPAAAAAAGAVGAAAPEETKAEAPACAKPDGISSKGGGSSSSGDGGRGASTGVAGGAPWWLATPWQLANRVVIRWCSGSLDRRAAMAQVLAGAPGAGVVQAQ